MDGTPQANATTGDRHRRSLPPVAEGRWPVLLYFFLLALHIVSLFVSGLPVGVTKLLLMPALGYAVWRTSGPPLFLYTLALLASWVGDYMLLQAEDGLAETASGFFSLGVVAFGIAHVLYTWLAVRAGARLPAKFTVAILVTLAVGASVLLALPGLILAYSVTILMLLTTVGTLPRRPAPQAEDLDVEAFAKTSFPSNEIFYGALAFVASDALIGLQMAAPGLLPQAWMTAGIMVLYGAGQWGLRGLARSAAMA